MRYEEVAKKLHNAGWEFVRQNATTHQRWRNITTGHMTTISFFSGKLELYQVRNLEKQFKVKLIGVK
jgi:predicted RNA binding protein YcfA (HicA-like mRNA interferase family)